MKLNLGKAIHYYDERGFGFIKPVCFSSDNSNSSKVFFHIKDVKHLDIESKLIGIEHDTPLYIWYISKETLKGIAVEECWSDYNLIPKEHLIDFVSEAFLFLTQEKSKLTQPQPTLQYAPLPPFPIQQYNPQYPQPPVQQPHPPAPQTYNPPIQQPRQFVQSTSDTQQYRFDDENKRTDIYKKNNCSPEEIKEIEKWIAIYKKNVSFIKEESDRRKISQQGVVNELITWGEFPIIRSLNDHGDYLNVPGIKPRYYAIVSECLGLTGRGHPLDDWRGY